MEGEAYAGFGKMEDLTIKSSDFSYQVTFTEDIESLPLENTFLLIDQNVLLVAHPRILNHNEKLIIEISESSKDLDTCKLVIESMARKGVGKNYTLLTIGGGATQDIGTLSASLYMRGLNWSYVPTTLMSMIDSCIGGKSAINCGEFKNIIGNFYPPTHIFLNVSLLDFENSIALSSGIAEGLKITYARNISAYVEFCEKIDAWRLEKRIEYLAEAISISLRCKKYFVENDEFDRDIRRNLNFGHSFAHALESATKFQVPHGIAVLIGMHAAVLRADSPEACAILTNRLRVEMGLSQFNNLKSLQINHKNLLEAFRRDKKNSNSSQVLVLPNNNGELGLCDFELSLHNFEKCAKALYLAMEDLGVVYEIL